jgi:lysophospholipase L1-like esterase
MPKDSRSPANSRGRIRRGAVLSLPLALATLTVLGLSATRQGHIAPQIDLPRLSGPGAMYAQGPILNPNLNEDRYIGFGDSITYGTINHDYYPELGYIPRLDKLLDASLAPSEVVNEGIGGEETSQALLRIDGTIAIRQSRYILIMEGTNDVTFLRAVPSSIANLRTMINKCLAYGMLPVLATIVPRRDEKWYIASHREIHLALNQAIRLLATEMKVPLADMDQVFNAYTPGGPEALLSEDLKHPNEKGYQVMAEAWLAAIKTIPFPPILVRARPDSDKILFYRKPGNMVTWQPNAKTEAAGVVYSHRIYRRVKGEGVAAFRLLGLVETAESYFDASAAAGTIYEYAVAAVRTDGVEGPCSAIATLEH